MEQRSPEWFAAPKSRVTASNVGAILGCDPYRGPDDVLRAMVREYHGAESEFKGNVATEWSTANEETARFCYEMETRNDVTDASFVPYQDWLGASPDGFVNGHLLEIKCPYGIRKHQEPVFKQVSEVPHYYAQMQIQMLCTGTYRCDFFQWTPSGTMLDVVSYSDTWMEENLPRLRDFYARYQYELSNQDHLEPLRKIVDNPDSLVLLEEFDYLKESIDLAKDRLDEITGKLIQMANGRDALINGRKFTKVEKKGSVAYAKIVKKELPDIDLEPYRGKSSESWRLS